MGKVKIERLRLEEDDEFVSEDNYKGYWIYLNDEPFCRDDSTASNFILFLVEKFGDQYDLTPWEDLDPEVMESAVEVVEEKAPNFERLIDDFNSGKLKVNYYVDEPEF